MLTSVSKRMAGDFFNEIDKVLTGAAEAPALEAPAAAAPGAPAEAAKPGEAFVAPARPAAAPAPGDFLKGTLVGGGLVLLGVIAGALASRKRG
jgi:hypothetical protein